MVSGCSIRRENENAPLSPVSLEDITSPISLPREDEKIFTMRIFLRLLADGNNSDAMQMLISHLCWENEFFTELFIEATYTGKLFIFTFSLFLSSFGVLFYLILSHPI